MKVSPEMDQDGVKNSRRIYFFGRKKHIFYLPFFLKLISKATKNIKIFSGQV